MRVVLFLLALALSALASEYNLKPVKVADKMWCVFGELTAPTPQNKGFVSNVCWVEGEKSVTLFDAGPTELFAKELDMEIFKTTAKKVSSVIVTNYHDDRILGAGYFQKRGAKIVAHKNIISDMAKNESKILRMQRLLPSQVYGQTTIVKPDTLFDGKEFEINGVKLLKLSAIAETPSDIVVWAPKQNAIFTGNIVFDGRLLNYDDDSRADGWIEALEKIEAMKPNIIISGHGDKLDKAGVVTTKSYLQTILRGAKKAIDDGVELENITKIVKAEEFSSLLNFKELHHRNLYNLYGHFELGYIK